MSEFNNDQLQKYGVIIQARMSSSRLSGKVLMDIEGQPLLLRQLRRLKHGLIVQKLLVATSDDPSDDPIEKLCNVNGFECFRGPLNDVMLRFILAGQAYGIDYIIRVGGDDCLIDPLCCNSLVEIQQRQPFDFIYASNRNGWPYGCAAELIRRSALESIHQKTSDPLYLEHTIPYFFHHPKEFRMHRAEAPENLQRPHYHLSMDFPEDLELIRTIFRKLRSEGDYFPLRSVIQLLDRQPDILDINKGLHQGFDH